VHIILYAEFVTFWSSFILFGHEKLSNSSDDEEEATNQSQNTVVLRIHTPSQPEQPHGDSSLPKA
jgi:hypothetical protein